MSEYQYYEFRAVDHPLTPQQQAELRSRSTRATITSTSFVNEYHWGSFKGDSLDWMRRYFDAHVYSANWGHCYLMLRLPIATLDKAILEPFVQPSQCGAQSDFCDALSATFTADHIILSWEFNDDSGEYERFWSQDDGPGWMSNLLPLRDELLRGDTRPLYLGWLARVCNDELAEDDVEPPLPAGLKTLTPAQIALTEFLQIDPDWLAASVQASSALPDGEAVDPEMDNWLAMQTIDEMQAMMRLLLEGRSQEAERTLRLRYLNWQRKQSTHTQSSTRRTVAEIGEGRAQAQSQRLEMQRQQQAVQEAQRQAQRLQQLEHLAAHSDIVWATIDKTLQRGSGQAYDQALQAVLNLHQALSLVKREKAFQQGLMKLLVVHSKRRSWVQRLIKAGFDIGEI